MSHIQILVVDDQEITHEALSSLIDYDKNISFIFCTEPLKALQMAREAKPSVILLDLVMPQIDGLLLLRYFKQDKDVGAIPVVILSIKEEQEVKAQAFQLGACDYMIKFPGDLELSARLHYHANNFLANQSNKRLLGEVAEGKQRLEHESQAAGTYLKALLPEPIHDDISCDWRYIPSMYIGGDLFGYKHIDPDHFIFFLYDVSGHGMRAALHSTTIFYAIQALCKSNIDPIKPQDVLKHLNDEFQMDKYDNTFFSMWFGIFNRRNRLLTYSSGGHPPAIGFMPFSNKKEELLYTHGMALGVDPHSVYEAFTIEVPKSSRIYLFSDGLFELANAVDKIMTFEQFVAIIKQPSFPHVKDLDRILHNTELLREGHPFEDDVCILQIDL